MTYQTEFPDFDPATMPAIPPTWADTSHAIEQCPCFESPAGSVYVDHVTPAEREFPESPRFTLHDEGGAVVVDSDEWADVLAGVVGLTFAAVLVEWLSPAEMVAVQRLNALDGPSSPACHSHDFCDSNMAMHEAFLRALGREPKVTGDDAPDIDLWNQAWTFAKTKRLSDPGAVLPGAQRALWTKGETIEGGPGLLWCVQHVASDGAHAILVGGNWHGDGRHGTWYAPAFRDAAMAAEGEWTNPAEGERYFRSMAEALGALPLDHLTDRRIAEEAAEAATTALVETICAALGEVHHAGDFTRDPDVKLRLYEMARDYLATERAHAPQS